MTKMIIKIRIIKMIITQLLTKEWYLYDHHNNDYDNINSKEIHWSDHVCWFLYSLCVSQVTTVTKVVTTRQVHRIGSTDSPVQPDQRPDAYDNYASYSSLRNQGAPPIDQQQGPPTPTRFSSLNSPNYSYEPEPYDSYDPSYANEDPYSR